MRFTSIGLIPLGLALVGVLGGVVFPWGCRNDTGPPLSSV